MWFAVCGVVAAGIVAGAPPAASVVRAPAVDIELDPDGLGYWVLDAEGGVRANGAEDFGDAVGALGGQRAVAMSATATGDGYWIFTDAGAALAFGAAPELGDVAELALNAPIVESVVTAEGDGYWLVAADGGVFALGAAPFYGSTGGMDLNQPVNGIVPDPDGNGYWLVAADGGVFSFGAAFRGSMGGAALNEPVVGAISRGDGYLLVAADGGIFDFSGQPFLGSLGDTAISAPAVAVAVTAEDDRYLILLADGRVHVFDGSEDGGTPVVLDGWLVGWWGASGWVQAPAAFDNDVDESRYPLPDRWALASADGSIVETEASGLGAGCFRPGVPPRVRADAVFGRVGVPTGVNAFPRPVTVITPTEGHVADVRAWLDANGFEDEPVEIDRVLRFDVEGDGVFEVLIEASHGDVERSIDAEAGDYSVIRYRRVGPDGGVESLDVGSHLVTAVGGDVQSILYHHQVLGLVDPDVDGVYELAVRQRGFESRYVRLLDLAGAPTTLFETGCGA